MNGKKDKADEGGDRTEPTEAKTVREQVDEGSVASMDDYLAKKDAEPGVSRQADPEEEESEETEDSTTEDTEAAEDTDAAEEESEETTEDTEETEESAEEEDADEEEHDLGLTDEEREALHESTTKKIDKKIGKQVARRKQAEERAETAEARIVDLEEQLEAAGSQPPPEGGDASPIMQAESEAEVDRHEAGLKSARREVRRWLDDHDREDVYTTAEGKEYSWAEVRGYQYSLEDELADIIPKARKAVARRQESVKAAKVKYPKLFDRKSEDHQAMQTILRESPQLKNLPNYHMLIGRMIAGEKLESAPSKAPAKKKAPPKPKAAKPPGTSAPSKTKRAPQRQQLHPEKLDSMDAYLGIGQT